jgi:hypothetical protein
LSLIGNAVLAKGKDFVERKLGVELKPDLSEAELVNLQIAQMEHEQELMRIELEGEKIAIEAFKAEAKAVSQRWTADMSSDSWMSKNIRPMTLIALLLGYFMFALMSAFGYAAEESYVTLLGQWGQIVMLAYFGGRTVEKVMDMRREK